MTGDPRERRKHAARCAELAVSARTPQLKITFLRLSKKWERFAIELEDAFGRLEEAKAIGSQARHSHRLLLSKK
jgi:hypothetical protein